MASRMSTPSVATNRRRRGRGASQVGTAKSEAMPEAVATWYKSALTKGVSGCVEEFRSIRGYVPSNVTANAFAANQPKNRYRDVVCVDVSRVQLKGDGGGYIHANYVNGSKMNNQFICCQGPLDNTAGDFWAMVWQDRVSLVVMLCDVVEKTKSKCAQYWPATVNQSVTHGAFKITNVSIKMDRLNRESIAKITCLELVNTAEPDAKPWPVLHCHWPDWPDRGIPPDSKTLIVLRKRILHHGFPVVVHCSAGIGRTGTLVAVDLLLGPLEGSSPKCEDVCTVVKRIRDQRLHSVQNEQQYVFIYRVLIDFISMRYKMPLSTPGLQDFWTKHLALQNATR